MIERLIRACVALPWLVILGTLAIIGAGWMAMDETPVDAIPDISENQVIVFTEWMGRSPQDVEDQITYPLSSELQGLPGVRAIRGMSGFGFSQIYVVFEDDVDFYWARSRVSERLDSVGDILPQGVQPVPGPEATALGQIFWYVLDAPGHDLGTLRSLQDYHLRYGLQGLDGVAEVASVGGFVRQYQIDVDPQRLRAHDLRLGQVLEAVRRGNIDVGAKTLERAGSEALIRGLGFIDSVEDIEDLVITTRDGVPVYVRNVAAVQLGPDFRRGALADAHGERVGGVVTMSYGANPGEVIARVKHRLAELEAGLPPGVQVVPFYDRSQLIDETMGTLREALIQELIITALVVLLFLLHVRASMIVAVTLPVAVLMAFLGMRVLGLGADIMSLAGIAVAIGSVVDMGIIMSENVFSALSERDAHTSRRAAITRAAAEVGPAILTAVSTTVISFLPVFFLTGQAGKLFKPLAWTKTFAMVASVILALTLVPALCQLFLREPARRGAARRRAAALAAAAFAGLGALLGWRLATAGVLEGLHPWLLSLALAVALGLAGWQSARERLRAPDDNPVSRGIIRVYQPALRWVLAHRRLFALAPTAIIVAGALIFLGARALLWPAYPIAAALDLDLKKVRPVAWLEQTLPGIGSAFMPPLDEGSYLAMPSLLPQASLNETLRVMTRMNAEIARVPEVAQVIGKLGRADTALDPAPVGMMETIVNLRPESEWRPGVERDDILQALKRQARIVGTTPSWLQPIETRVVMLQSGIRATMALRLSGAPRRPDGSPHPSDEALRLMEQTVIDLEDVVRDVPGAIDVTALRLGGKPYIEFDLDREAIARHGLQVRDVQDVIEVAIGGVNIAQSLEGRERYPIRVQYPRALRDSVDDLRRLMVPTPAGAHVPLGALADVRDVIGPAAIRTEGGQLTAYLMFNAFERDEAAVIEDALAAAEQWRQAHRADTGEDPIPAGLSLTPTGRYLNKLEADRRLLLIVPLVLALNLLLIFLQFRKLGLTLTIFSAIPVAFGGGFLMLWLYPHALDALLWLGLRDAPSPGPIYLTTAVWVGFIALFGVAVDDGVVIATYLDQSFAGRLCRSADDIREAIVAAGTRRIRPMLMTTTTTILALTPILWSEGRGSDLMQPMALPLVGGMAFAFITVFVVPAVYCAILERRLRHAPSGALLGVRAWEEGGGGA